MLKIADFSVLKPFNFFRKGAKNAEGAEFLYRRLGGGFGGIFFLNFCVFQRMMYVMQFQNSKLVAGLNSGASLDDSSVFCLRKFALPKQNHAIRMMRTLLFVSMVGIGGLSMSLEARPLKVFVLVGQSNMQGHAHVRTLEHLGMDPKTAPILNDLTDSNGKPRVSKDVWITYLSAQGIVSGQLTAGFGASEEKIGPEWSFGIYLQKMVNEPILLIKAAWGGKSLNTDFRSPSAGPYEFNSGQLENFKKQGKDLDAIQRAKAEATGHYYRETVAFVKKSLAQIQDVYPGYKSDEGYELAGMIWFQGWNDMVDRGTYPERDQPGGYGDYSDALAHFIRDIRKDLEAPELPFVIGVLGVGGPVDLYLSEQQRYKGIHQNYRDAMAAPARMPEFKGNVSAVLTEKYWDQELTRLRARQNEINQKVRKTQSEKNLSRAEQEELREQSQKEAFTSKELLALEKGVSNGEYHYLGSAKILTQIGKAFAESMHGLLKH